MFAKRLNEKGAGLIEYGSLVGLLAATAIGVVLSMGSEVDTTFKSVNSELTGALAIAIEEEASPGSGSVSGPSGPVIPSCATGPTGSGGQYLLVDLGADGILSVGDLIYPGGCSVSVSSNVGSGSWVWSGSFGGSTFTNLSETGEYWLATDGNTYFRPDFGLPDTITAATAN